MPSKDIIDRGTFLDPENVPSTLKRNELSLQAKREHLAAKGIKGEEARLILEKVYGRA